MNTFSIIIGYFIATLSWALQTFFTLRWQNRQKLSFIHPQRPVYIFIPIYNEVARIQKTVEYFWRVFGKQLTALILITTEKERMLPQPIGCLSTIDVADTLESTFPGTRTIHYPNRQGTMAHQLNYAIQKLQHEGIPNDVLLAFYNADSRPDPRTLQWVINHAEKDSLQVFQQFGSYTNNFKSLLCQRWSWILAAAALWQTRWSLGFEISHALIQQWCASSPSRSWMYSYTYCIGHGLWMTPDVLPIVGGFSEQTHNEDAILGLALSEHSIPTKPIPYFEEADTPDSIRGLLHQQTSWFFGPLQFWQYYQTLAEQTPSRFRLFIHTMQLASHAVYWIAGPTFFGYFLAVALILHTAHSLFWLLFVLFLFFGIPNLITLYSIPSSQRPALSLTRLAGVSLFGSPVFYLLHGLSAYVGLFLWLRLQIIHSSFTKTKTPMRADIPNMGNHH